MDKIQQEFEAWLKSGGNLTMKEDDGQYSFQHTRFAFEAWKSSRASLCVDLNNVVFSRDKNGEGGLMLPERVFKAMDDAGVSYK